MDIAPKLIAPNFRYLCQPISGYISGNMSTCIHTIYTPKYTQKFPQSIAKLNIPSYTLLDFTVRE